VVYFGQDGDLVVGELAQLGRLLELLDVHHLHCEDLLVFAVLCLVDVAVLPLADLLEQDVVFYYLVHLSLPCTINIKNSKLTLLIPYYQIYHFSLFWVVYSCHSGHFLMRRALSDR
jgi:hypothetical protein